MKWAGALLVLAGAWGCCLLWRRTASQPLRVGQALLGDLSVLSYQICVRRAPLPEILSERLCAGEGAVWLWGPLAAGLEGERPLPECWTEAAGRLPGRLPELLEPLGALLPAGGERLSAAVEETREELHRYLREERAELAARGRIAAALCLSGASLLILVLV